MPKIGSVGTSATPSSSLTPLASNAASQPFSAVFEQAKPSLSELVGTQAGTNNGPVQGNCSSVSGPPKRETKSSDSKTTDPQGGGNGSIQTSAYSPDAQDKTVPVVVVQPMPSPVIPSNAAVEDFTADAVTGTVLNDKLTSSSAAGADSTAKPDAIGSILLPASPATAGADATAKPDAAGGSALPPTLSQDVVPAEPEGGTSTKDSANPSNANTSEAGAVASLIADMLVTAPGSINQPGSVALPPRNLSRATAQPTDGVNKAQAAAKAETEQVISPAIVPAIVTPSVIPLAIVPPTSGSGTTEPLSTQGTLSKPAVEKSRVGATTESSGTTGKNVEVIGSTKAQPRKDDSPSAASSQAADLGASDAPLKVTESSPSSSPVGVPVSPAAGDGKSASASVSPDVGNPQTGQLDQKSTGVAETQSHTDDAAVAYPTSLVQSAKLVERIGEAELRLGIRAGEFGSVDIRTSMVRNQFTAEISVERSELGRVLTAELPSLQNRLAEQRVQVANITVQNHTGSHSTASEQQKPRDGQQVYTANPISGQNEGLMPALVALEGTASESRLDVHM